MEVRGLVYYLNPLPLFVVTGCLINKSSTNTAVFNGCLSIEAFRERQEVDGKRLYSQAI